MDNRRDFFGKLAALAAASKSIPEPEPEVIFGDSCCSTVQIDFEPWKPTLNYNESFSKYDPEVLYWNEGHIGHEAKNPR